MKKLTLVSVSTETEKKVKREFGFPVASITPQVREVTKDGVSTVKVSSGSVYFNVEAVTALNLLAGDTITISDAEEGLFVYKSTSFKIASQFKKKLTKSGILRLSGKNLSRIYADNGLNKTEPCFFKLEECTVDIDDVTDARVFEFTPLEKSA